MQFKTWLEAANWMKKSVLSKVDDIIRQEFPQADPAQYGPTLVYLAKLPNGHSVTVSLYREKPNKIQIGFSMDRPVRKQYGVHSDKDVASNQHVMPGTFGMLKSIKRLTANLKNSGFDVWCNPIDDRRDAFFSKHIDITGRE